MIEQVFIAVTELIAIWLIQEKRQEYKRWASVFGLLGQPFWFYASYTAEQWGSFILCFFFTAAWIRSFKQCWLTKEQGLTNQDYYELLVEALGKIEVDKSQKLDYKDYIKRVFKEALK